MIALALRTLVRYLVPLAIATALVAGPLLLAVLRVTWPTNLPAANAALVRGWVVGATGWMFALVLVAAAAPLVRSVAAGTPLSQLAAMRAALANLVRMAVPCLAAIAAVLVGGLALAIPALALLVLLSLTGASTERGMPAPLVDSAQAVRAHWRPIAAIVLAMIVVDLALVAATWKLTTIPFAKKLAPAQWATYGNVARIAALGVAVTAPVFATLLAAARARR